MSRRIELPDDLVKDVENRAAQEGERLEETVARLVRAGLEMSAGSTHIHVDASVLEERRKSAEKFLSGEWGVKLDGFEDARAADREAAEMRNPTLRR